MADVLRKKRTAAKSWATRAKNALYRLLSGKDISKAALKDGIGEVDKRLQALDLIQGEFELELEESDFEEEISSASEFREGVRAVRVKAAELLEQLEDMESGSADSASVVSSSSSQVRVEAKLPKLSLPKFSGKVLEWTSFWDQFLAIIDHSEMAEINKYAYLKSLLEGEAAEAISGLTLSADNYDVACDILTQRYGRTALVRFSHIQELLNIVPLARQASCSDLRKLYDKLFSHVRGLENLGIGGAEYGIFLTPLVLACLPSSIRMEWARGSEGREGDLEWLLEFLDTEIENRERCNTFKSLLKVDSKDAKVNHKEAKVSKSCKGYSTASALSSVSATPRRGDKSVSVSVPEKDASSGDSCGICGRRHLTSKCYDLINTPSDRRVDLLKRKGLCFKCLGRGHLCRTCTFSCERCSGNHHFLLCRRGSRNESGGATASAEATGSSVSYTGLTTRTDGNAVLLQVLTVKVRGSRGVVSANVLLDSGSDKTYVSRDLVKKCQPSFVGSEHISCASFGSSKASRQEVRNVFSLDLQGLTHGQASLHATEMDVISVPIHRRRVPADILQSFSHLDMAVNYEVDQHLPIDILIGLDHYWQLVLPVFEQPVQGLVAQKTVFGWMLSGVVPTQQVKPNVSHQFLCICNVSDTDVRNFWEIEYELPEVDSPTLQEFERNISWDDGRYVVALPWSQPSKGKALVDNYDIAFSRLKSLSRKLDKDPVLHDRYNAALVEMEDSGVVEEVPPEQVSLDHPVFYLPHRPVVRESSSSTKVRPVFDASAKGSNGVSLNDCMDKGPNLIPSLVQILIKFRKWPVALVADIRKAFLQIGVRREDQDVHRFLWLLDGAVRVMRIVRVPFGNRSSPFLLNATIQHHLMKYDSTKVVSELSQNLYVDDWLSGADSLDEAKSMIEEASSLMLEAGMVLTKWGSNKDILQEAPLSSYDLSDKSESVESVKILGLQWNRLTDSFSFEGIDMGLDLVLTKRIVLSFIARLFDPLGFLSPFVMTLKCLFQELWKLGLEWDDEIPETHRKIVEVWLSDLLLLKEWKIPRPFSLGCWKDVESLQLHGFGDASEKGYGACIYLLIKRNDDSLSSTLVLSKAKVAPLKRVTLPRLELLGAVVVAQLLEFVRQVLDISIDCCFGWSDSSVVLSWIKGNSARWKPFVANRTAEIQRATNPSQWSFCKGTENPADLLTRGISADSLKRSKLWLHGPPFLLVGVSTEPIVEVQPVVEDCESVVDLDEVRDEVVVNSFACTLTQSASSPELIDLERFSSFPKCVSVMAWVLRFIRNCRSPRHRSSGELSFDELESSKLALFRSVQNAMYAQEIDTLKTGDLISQKSNLYSLSPFVDNNGILRVRTRLEFSDLEYDEKCPVIIPKGRLAELIVLFQHHLLKHAGVNLLVSSLRSAYWIIGLRRLAKRVKRFCFQCQRLDSAACSQVVAPLPSDRVKPAAPFAVIGVDHAGPLYCSDVVGKKFYILLITCAVVRAVHLELVDSLGVEDCVCAFRKFIARRGMPSIVYSDNAKTFQATKSQLHKLYSSLCPDWRFIVPRAPWWGGWWERLVRTTKSALRKSVGVRTLVRKELEAVLIEIEACINSRPLTAVHDSSATLTPAHFLIGRSHMFEKQDGSEIEKVSLLDRKAIQDSVLEKFWDIWSKSYLRNLPVHGQGKDSELSVGSLVLVREDGQPRLTWPIAVVTQVFPGRDQIVRSCSVRFRGSEYMRPIQKLHKLECEESQDPQFKNMPSSGSLTADVTATDNVRISRYGRHIKNVQRLEL